MEDEIESQEREGGFGFDHPTRRSLPLLVAPATGGETNAVRQPLVPIACWSIGDIRFEFDSSFVKPEIIQEPPLLAKLLVRHSVGDVHPSIHLRAYSGTRIRLATTTTTNC